ncbi:MAG: polysaccharide deacetylase family protein [Terrimonas sp.]|nr:polysaccharide deacetylase family protein [Terrimonas sp.]OJY93831.1 MAG: polysaccharide deacetylase [Sphingobacteriales bacterium 40-81]
MITILKRSFKHLIILSALLPGVSAVNAQQSAFQWPKGIKAAISLSFDDARLSQVDVGTPLLDQYGIKATFVLVPSNVEKRIDKWKQAAANGHELGNHTLNHPCSGNFSWSKQNALENYTLKKMREELVETNRQLEHLLGVKATVFAYPCGSTYIGRGVKTKSYIPLIAKLFDAGRGWLNETPNDPSFCDFAQLTGMEMDGKDFDQLLPLIENSKKSGSWIILAGHEIGESGNQTTRVEMLKKLIAYAQDPANGIWIAPMGEIARYVKEQRATSN